MYLLRTSTAWKFPVLLEPIDALIKVSVGEITNTKMGTLVWKRATKPIRSGGLGIRLGVKVVLAAFLASTYSTVNLMDRVVQCEVSDNLEQALAMWRTFSPKVIPPPEGRVFQRVGDDILVASGREQILADIGNERRVWAGFLASYTGESGAWLYTLPAVTVENLLDPNTFRISVAFA